jgi:hypothetical protein
LAPQGRYSEQLNYPWTNLAVSPLHPSGSGAGVYRYGSGAAFPSSSWNNCNYWVDVVFVPASGSGSPVYTISGTVTGSSATLTLSGAKGAVTQTDSAGKYQFTGLANGAYVVAPSRTGYSFSPATRAVSVNGANVSGINFTAAVAPLTHNVTINWIASSSTGVVGYNVYRSSVAGGPYTKVNAGLITGTGWIDYSVAGGQKYYYVATAVNADNLESAFSGAVSATVPL